VSKLDEQIFEQLSKIDTEEAEAFDENLDEDEEDEFEISSEDYLKYMID